MNKLKRIAATILALSLCITLIPAAAFAEAKPDSYVSIITLDNGNILSIGYLYRSDGKTPSTILGASYDASTNTLTLDGRSFNGSARFVEANMMGDDFKINIIGEVSLANIAVYSGSLSIVGNGSLSVNKNHNGYLYSGSYAAIDVEGEQTAATLTIGPDVTVHAFGFDDNSRAIFVSNTSVSTDGIAIAGRLNKGQVNYKRHLSYVIADEGTENSVNGNLYTKDGSSFIIQTIYNNGKPFYNIYNVAESGGKYTAPSLVNSDMLSAIPADYIPVYSDYYSWNISSDSNFLNDLSEVIIAASGSEIYTVEYYANYPEGPDALSQEKVSGMELALLGTNAFARPGYVFSGWNTAADGSGISYEAQSRYTADAGLKLYAQWTPALYSVVFDLNGGVGTAEAKENISYGSSITLPDAPEKTNFRFLGWKTGETTYPAGTEYTVTADAEFAASWEEIKTVIKVPCIDSYEALNKTIIVHGDYDYYFEAQSEIEIDPNCNAKTAELVFYDSFYRPTTVSAVTIVPDAVVSFDAITWDAQKYTLSLIPEGLSGLLYSESNPEYGYIAADGASGCYLFAEDAESLTLLNPQFDNNHLKSEYNIPATVGAIVSGSNIKFELRKQDFNASLSGTVTSGGFGVAGAVVSATQTINPGTPNESILSYSTVTGSKGSYAISRLAAGYPVAIRVEADGYASFKTTHPLLSSGSNQHAEIVLSKTGIIKVVSDNEISEAKFLVNGVAAKADSTFGSSFTVTIPEGVAAPSSVTVQSPVIKDGSITVSVSVSDGIGYAYLSPQLRGKLDWSKVQGGKYFAILDEDRNTAEYIQCGDAGFLYLNEGSYTICTANQHIPYAEASRDPEYYNYVTKEISGSGTVFLENEDFPDYGIPVLAGSVNAPADASENELYMVTGVIQSVDAEIVKLEAILPGGKLAGFSVNGKLAVNTNVHEDYALIEKDNEKNLKLDWGTPLSYTVYVSMGNKQQSVDIYATVKDSAGKTTKAYVGTAITSLNPGLTLNVPNKVGGAVDANGILQPSQYRFSGTAPAGSLVKLYDNDKICAAATADKDNHYEGTAVLNSCLKGHTIRAELNIGAETYSTEKFIRFEPSGAVLKEITMNGISVIPGGSAAAYAATPSKVYDIDAFFENGDLLSDQSFNYGDKILEGKVIFRVATIGNTYYYTAEKKSDNHWSISIRLGLEYPTSIKVLYKTETKSAPTTVTITTTEGESVDIEASAVLQLADAEGNILTEPEISADWAKFFEDVYNLVNTPYGLSARIDQSMLLGSVMLLFAAAPSSTQLAFEDVFKLIDDGNATEVDLAEGYKGASLVSASNAQDITRSDEVQIIQYYDNPTYAASSFVYRNSELKGKGYEVQTLENGRKQYILYKGTFYYDSFAYPTTGPTETYIDGGVRKTRDNPKMYNKGGEIIGSKLKVLYLYSVSDNKWYRMQEAIVGVNSKPPIFTHVNQIPGTEPPNSYSPVSGRANEPELIVGSTVTPAEYTLYGRMFGTTFCGLRLNINPKKISAKTWASAGAAATNYGISKLTSKLNTKLKTFKIEETERELLTKVVSDGKTHYLKHYQTVTTTWTLESNHVAAGAISPSLAFLPNSIQGSSPATLPEAFNTLRSKLTNELRRYTELGAKYPDNVSIPYLKKDIGKLLNQLTDLEELLDTAKTQNEFTENVGNGLTYLSMLCSFDFANGAEEAACVDSINIFFNAANDTANEDTIDALADFILRYDAYRDFSNRTNQTLGDDENKPSGGGSGGSFGDSSECSNSSYDHNYDADAVFTPVHDPSGIVYEAVLSNPVEGAQVTLYNAQKADGTLILENEVGEYETAVKRIHDDAPYLKQQNPVVTGKDGVYQWFVPSGLWYVEASKAGYSSGDSSCDINATISANGTKYMPVLPPQLNVNIPLIDVTTPCVTEAIYRPEGVYVIFSKYMDESTLIASNITVDGETSGFAVELLDSEKAPNNIVYSGEAPSYTKSILVKYDTEKPEGVETSLEISSALMSYAGSHLIAYSDSGNIAAALPLPAPSFSLKTGSAVEENTPISLSCEDSSAQIYYTTDGSVPTAASKLYTGPIVITGKVTIKAIAIRTGYPDSSVAEGSYTIAVKGNITPPPSNGGHSSHSSHPANVVEPVQKINFVDVPETAYYYDAVAWAVSKGITFGVDETHFAPDNITTRAQMITFLWTAAGSPEPKSKNCFSDVKPGSYYEKAVTWALENGITAGTGDGSTFSPDDVITRAQAMALLFGFSKQPAPKTPVQFTDVKETDYYYDAVNWGAQSGITSGTSAATFSPSDVCARAQTITFLYRYSIKK